MIRKFLASSHLLKISVRFWRLFVAFVKKYRKITQEIGIFVAGNIEVCDFWALKNQMCQCLNSRYFHIIGDKLINPIVGLYIPIIRISIKRCDDHPPTKRDFWPWHKWIFKVSGFGKPPWGETEPTPEPNSRVVRSTVGSVFLGGSVPYLGVSKNRGTPKSSILIGFSIINHPFWGTPIVGNTHLVAWKFR